jgi:hypothetical protein
MVLPTSKRSALHAQAAPCLPCPIKHQAAAKSRYILEIVSAVEVRGCDKRTVHAYRLHFIATHVPCVARIYSFPHHRLIHTTRLLYFCTTSVFTTFCIIPPVCLMRSKTRSTGVTVRWALHPLSVQNLLRSRAVWIASITMTLVQTASSCPRRRALTHCLPEHLYLSVRKSASCSMKSSLTLNSL